MRGFIIEQAGEDTIVEKLIREPSRRSCSDER
jgi:hypothetical protein